MTEIYLIRHTQAEGNLYRMMQGHWDGDVTQLGLKQIDALADRFRNIHLDAVFSSDLYRAMITASALTRENRLQILPVKELREIDLGPWEQLFFGNVMHDEPELSDLFMYDSEKWKIDGAETFEDVKNRAVRKVQELSRGYDGKTIAIVSHGVTIRCFLSGIFDIPLTDLKRNPICGNTAVTKLFYHDDQFTAEYVNDTSHLGQLGGRKWSATNDLRDEIFDPSSEPDLYQQCYSEAWELAHHGEHIPDPEPYFRSAVKHFHNYHRAVLKLLDGESTAGLLDMDTERGRDSGYGWISLLYLKPEYRMKGYGIQALARAIQEYRKLGRRSIRLSVNEENLNAIKFYDKNGFVIIKKECGMNGIIYTMEKNLERRNLCLTKK